MSSATQYPQSRNAFLQIKISNNNGSDYYYDPDTHYFDTTQHGVNINCQGSTTILNGTIDISSYEISSGINGTLEVLLEFADNSDGKVSEVHWLGLTGWVASTGNTNNASTKYQIAQNGSYSTAIDLGKTIYGIGPVPFARAAIHYEGVNPVAYNVLDDRLYRIGKSESYSTTELVLKEMMELSRSARRRIDMDL